MIAMAGSVPKSTLATLHEMKGEKSIEAEKSWEGAR